MNDIEDIVPEDRHSLIQKGVSLLIDTVKPRIARSMSMSDVRHRMDMVGVDTILEEIAQGSIPALLSHAYEVPYLFFMVWIKESVAPELIKMAKHACADSLMAQAQLTLARTATSKHEASQYKDYAKQLTTMAAQLNSEDWGIIEKAKPPAPSVHINIGNKSGVIPGLEILG